MEGESVQTRSFLQPAEEEERSQQSGGNIFHLLQLSGSTLPWFQGSLLTKPLFSYDVCNSVLSVKALVGAFSVKLRDVPLTALELDHQAAAAGQET